MTSYTCTVCSTAFDIPPLGEEESSTPCPRCGITVRVAGRRNVREAGARMANEEDQRRGYRMPLFHLELKGRYPEESDEAFARRIRIRQGLPPTE